MALEVIGAGFGRTGTLSLKSALEKLGFSRCYHMYEVAENRHHLPVWLAAVRGDSVDWHALFEGYRASLDWPACSHWRAQLEAFPEAKVLLSLRDPERWYESVMDTIWRITHATSFSNRPSGNDCSYARTASRADRNMRA